LFQRSRVLLLCLQLPLQALNLGTSSGLRLLLLLLE
jgi:hypothetical protein